jgi:hypothetical protein
MYALLAQPLIGKRSVLRLADGAIIPDDPDNADWQDVQAWLDEGNTMPEAPPDALVEGSEYQKQWLTP